MIDYRHADARVGVTAVPDGAVLPVRTRRRLLFCRLRLVALHVHAGMENLSASHQKNGQGANNPDLPSQETHRGDRSPIREGLSTQIIRSCNSPRLYAISAIHPIAAHLTALFEF
ncbi:MAG: hypothetical protein WC003_02170 [Terrimicrobiaceae bacterium]